MAPLQNALISVAVVVLAAGRSSRMERSGHKLLARFRGVTLVRLAALAATGCESGSVVMVTGYRGTDIEAEIAGLELSVVRNFYYADGMASSIVLGVGRAADFDPDGIMIMLADMPLLKTKDLDTLIGVFRTSSAKAIVRAACDGVPGNPVIFPRSAFAALQGLRGDNGARAIISQSALDVIDVEIGVSAKMDIDTTEQLFAFGAQPEAN
ncbi:nucleotidyltransferase family protein [Rhizobium indigoferae]|nr:nucleotidyltransferase family protein [Rhizobium indigoferae]NNU56212.1 nucleotidyltransferase family protein [Rhizobium indigoferae]GLR59258.1 molybdopterin-guanine dinucleotide biosynthesis protein MobA [Rhizobium indigoferae]